MRGLHYFILKQNYIKPTVEGVQYSVQLLALSPGHSQLLNVARCNVEKIGGAWGQG